MVAELRNYISKGEPFNFYKKILGLATAVTAILIAVSTLPAAIEKTLLSSNRYANAVDQFYSELSGSELSSVDLGNLIDYYRILTMFDGTDVQLLPQTLIFIVDWNSRHYPGYLENAAFPICFENAKLAAMPCEAFDVAELQWMPGPEGGVDLNQKQLAELRVLLQMFGPCTGTLDNPVIFDLVGFCEQPTV